MVITRALQYYGCGTGHRFVLQNLILPLKKDVSIPYGCKENLPIMNWFQIRTGRCAWVCRQSGAVAMNGVDIPLERGLIMKPKNDCLNVNVFCSLLVTATKAWIFLMKACVLWCLPIEIRMTLQLPNFKSQCKIHLLCRSSYNWSVESPSPHPHL